MRNPSPRRSAFHTTISSLMRWILCRVALMKFKQKILMSENVYKELAR